MTMAAREKAKENKKSELRVPDAIDIAAIRQRQNLSQNEFAKKYGIAPGTLRHWEQGRGEIPILARLLLTIIDKEPDAVARALRR
jgi:putative transcriptional regulator